MLDREPDHERDEEGRQDEEKCCDDAKDESRYRFAATSEVGLRLDRVQRLQPDHQRDRSAQGRQIAHIPPAIAMMPSTIAVVARGSLGWIHTGFGGIGTWEEWFGGTAGKGAGGMALGPGGWVMVSPRFGESSVRMAQRCSAYTEHAGTVARSL